MDSSLIHQIFIYLINLTGFCLAIWVYLANPMNKANKVFSMSTIFILLWVNFAFLANLPTQADRALLWIRLNFGIVSLFFISIYFFSIYFPQEKKRVPVLDKAILIIGIFFFLASVFTNFIIKDVEFKEWGVEPILGKGNILFLSVVIVLTFLISLNIFKKYFILPSQEKTRVQYFLIGLSLFALFNLIFNVILPIFRETYEYQHFGDYSIIFLLGFTAFAIVRRQLFGIKVVLTALLVVLIAILLLLNTLIFTESTPFQVLNGVIFVVFLFFGYYLIRSVQMEIKRREEMEELSLQLRRANVELDKLSKSKSEFLSIASHQLRTPLTAVKGYISMMLEKIYGKPPEKMKKPLENVYNSNERLIRLVNDLLNLSRLDAGKIEFSPELTSLEDMVSGIVEELRINTEKKGLYMKMVKPSGPLPKIMADRGKLRQVILNIVDNAIKYTKEGGITLEFKKLDEREEIKVSDTGEGMDKEELNSLFQMFSRATAGTQLHTEGAGIGLYVAKQFIEMHGGKIWAESEGKGKGSTFIIQLPIKLDLKAVEEKTRIIKKVSNK